MGKGVSSRTGSASAFAAVFPRLALVSAIVLAIAAGGASLAHADEPPLGGPVIIGGDDLNDHGSEDEGGNPLEGWLYITKAVANIAPQVTKENDNTIAALGSNEFDGETGRAIEIAAIRSNLTVEYVDNAEGINLYLQALARGEKHPRILYISGDGGSNDLSTGDGDEGAALAANATTIANFVNAGGGLFSHGSDFRWLVALLPGLTATGDGGEEDLYRTPEGIASFPDVSDDDFNAGPWHNHFEGNFGGLQVLVRSNQIDDSSGNDAAVIIGGSAVTLPSDITLEPQSAEKGLGESHTVTATVRANDGSPKIEEEVQFAVISGPNAETNGTDTTDSQGQATFTYTGGDQAGTDTIEASFTDDSGAVRTARATVTWGRALSIDDVTVDEGKPANFTITLNPPVTQGCECVVTVDAATQATGSAESDVDFTPAENHLTFAAGETTKTFAVETLADGADEPDETFQAILSNASGASIVDGVGVGTIRGTAAPPPPPAPAPQAPPGEVVPAISIDDVTATEGGTAAFTVRLTEVSSRRVTVDYETADGTGKAAGDYVGARGSVSFEPGERVRPLSIATSDDPIDEPDETFTVRLSNPGNATIQHGTGTATVRDDADGPPTVSVVDVTVVEGNPQGFMALTVGPTFAVFTLALSAPSGYVVTVDYATADGTARGGTDYTPTSGTATFQPGETTRTVVVPVTPNTNDELDRSFFLRLGGGSNNGGSTDAEAQGTIQDDDDPPPPVAGQAGNASVKSGTILIKLPGTDVFVALTGPLQLPIGTVVDATRGTVVLQMSDGAGGTYTGEFSAGIFIILEQTRGVVRRLAGADAKKPPKAKKSKAKKPKRKATVTVLFTTLQLEGGDFGICNQSRRLSGAAAKKPKPKAVRRLWGDSKGKFRTKGRHSAATVRGTRWLTSDRCDGTLTYVAQGGPVSVLDFRLGRTIELRQSQTYVAKPRGRR